jgi:chromosome segregation ATPase
MTMLAKTMLLLLTALPVHADVVLDEIKANLEDAQKKVETAKNQIETLQENDGKLKENLEELEGELNKKLSEQRQAKETHADYSGKLTATSNARREFDRSLAKDRQELELVKRDIGMVEKKLEALKAAKKALEESIEISEDNLSKMNDRSGSWQKNRDHLQKELTALDKDIVELEKQRDAQAKLRLENQQALNKWKKTLATQESAYQKLEARYRAAVREAEQKQKSRR